VRRLPPGAEFVELPVVLPEFSAEMLEKVTAPGLEEAGIVSPISS